MNGYHKRKVLATVGEINVRDPRDRLALFEERVIGRYKRRGGGKCLKSLKERGIGDPVMFITDGLRGMPESIRRISRGPPTKGVWSTSGGTCRPCRGGRTGR